MRRDDINVASRTSATGLSVAEVLEATFNKFHNIPESASLVFQVKY
jgi:hypothetical protein